MVEGDLDESFRKIFDSSYQMWLGGKRMCIGDGERAQRVVDKQTTEIACVCPELETKRCKQRGVLKLSICALPFVGYWEVGTSSWSSIHQLSTVLKMYYEILGAEFFKTKFVLYKRQEQKGERTVWVTHLNLHPDEVGKLPIDQINGQAGRTALNTAEIGPLCGPEDEDIPF